MDLPEGDIRKLLPNKDDQLKWVACSSHLKCFSLEEVETITGKYETMIGQGGYGQVYKGILENKTMVAVKKIMHMDDKMNQNFIKELHVHSRMKHKNVTRLIGYCFEENALVMVTEYIPGGNLSDFLHKNKHPISLDTRLRIAIECADALIYMHTHMYTRVIHGDIKPDNILLDHNLSAKISDFRISRLVNTDKTLYTKNVVGCIGYMDPLFFRDGRLSPDNDVYSFGVVLLELFTRKSVKADNGKTSLVNSFTESLSTKGLRKWVQDKFDAEIVDQSNMKILQGIGKLVGDCLSMDKNKRPDMIQVAERLRTLTRTLEQGEENPLFFWRMKHKPATSTSKPAAPASNPAATKNKLVMLGWMTTVPQLEFEDLLRGSAEVLGRGTIGSTYKVVLENGSTLVVKRMKINDNKDSLSEKEFRRRAAAIGAIPDEHIQPLLYYYFSKDEKLLVYDYMPIGSLATLLHGDLDDGRAILSWEQRSSIALNVARGLAMIHSAGAESCHGNIKSSNVLLTSSYEARLSEHGLTTLFASPDSLNLINGYHAPEAGGGVSQEADMYSFGVLLLELLTGEEPISHTGSGKDLRRLVQLHVREEWTAEVIDYRLQMNMKEQNSVQVQAMNQLLQLAMDCCTEEASNRPTIAEVVLRIEDIQVSQW